MATAVFFHAHPDDEAIATGGTMAKAVRDGHRAVLVVATGGEEGEPQPGVLRPGESLAERRMEETCRSAAILGVDRVEFLGYRDSGMMGEATNDHPDCFWRANLEAAARRVADLLVEEDAEVLTVYDSHGGYGHPDHIQVHRVGVRAAELAGVASVFEATMNRDAVRDRVMAADAEEWGDDLEERRRRFEEEPFGLPESELTHAVDVRHVLALKRKALEAHASQISHDSFFLKMPPDVFEIAFGTEWFRHRSVPRDGGAFGTDLFAPDLR